MTNFIGRKFGRLSVIRLDKSKKSKTRFWVCVCVCGNFVSVRTSSLNSGKTKSCGCLRCDSAKATGRANKTHGGHGTKEYRVWLQLRQRCKNSKSTAALNVNRKNYYDRGIRVCKRWKNSFSNFLKDMGSRPSRKHSIDRIDNNGGYEPGNCRWALMVTQSRNKRTNLMITYNGITQCLTEWAEDFDLSVSVLWNRVKRLGWSISKALNAPIGNNSGKR